MNGFVGHTESTGFYTRCKRGSSWGTVMDRSIRSGYYVTSGSLRKPSVRPLVCPTERITFWMRAQRTDNKVQPLVGPRMAAVRDASWYNYPGWAGKYHIVHGDRSACGRCPLIMNDEDYMKPASSIPEHMRCRKHGCAEAWPNG